MRDYSQQDQEEHSLDQYSDSEGESEQQMQEEQEQEEQEEESQESEEEEEEEDKEMALNEEEKEIKEMLKTTSFATLLQMKKEMPLVKQRQQIMRKEKGKMVQPKKSKQAPLVRSSKQKVRHEVPTIFESKRQGQKRDPRFDQLSGQLNTDLFSKTYGFLSEQKKEEIGKMKTALKKKGLSEEQKGVLRQGIMQNKNELHRQQHNDKVSSAKRRLKQQVNKHIQKGNTPFYHKKSQLQQTLIQDKYDELLSKGKLDRYLQNKKKKQDQKLMMAYHKISGKADRRAAQK